MNKAGVRLFLAATVLVLASLVLYVLGVIEAGLTYGLLALIVILTAVLLTVIRLGNTTRHYRMPEDKIIAEPVPTPKKSEEILTPEAARQWLDDFLVEQQKDV